MEYGGHPPAESRTSSALNALVNSTHSAYSYHCQGPDIDHGIASAPLKAFFESAEYRPAPNAWLIGPVH